MRILGKRILIKKLDRSHTTKEGITWNPDSESLPLIEIILVGDEVKDLYNVGEKGKVVYNEEEHFLVHADTIAAII